MKYIFLNWKAFTDYTKAMSLAKLMTEGDLARDLQIVVLPPAVFILPVVEVLKSSRVLVGLQDVSSFESGPYTGEVPASLITPYARFCLIGHSERRKNFNESAETINQKIQLCHKYGIIPVVCVATEDQLKEIRVQESQKDIFIAYERPEDIGGETSQEIGEILDFARLVESSSGLLRTKFIYGGSVNETNFSPLLSRKEIDGLLVGHVSLEPQRIRKILFR